MIKYFDTLNDFFNTENKGVAVNDFVRTYGYSAVNDGGSGFYKVENITDSDEVIFSGLKVTCAGHTLELIPEEGTVKVEQFGAVADCDFVNMTTKEKNEFFADNRTAIQIAVDSGARKVEFSSGTYYVADDILISRPVDIVGNGAKLVLEPTSTVTGTQLFRLDYDALENEVNTATVIRDFCIVGACGNSELSPVSLIRINCAYNVTISNIRFDSGDYAVYAKKSELEGYNVSGIKIVDCTAENMSNGFAFYTATNVKIRNCRMKLSDGGVGVSISDNSNTFNIEDVTVLDGEVGVNISNGTWNGKATERIFLKNTQMTNNFTAVNISEVNIPVHLANTMAEGVNVGICMVHAENVTMTNSSVLLVEPSEAEEYTVPVLVLDYAKAKFTHTQFEFPRNFQRIDFETDEQVINNLVFVDCTLQKTDIASVEGVVSPCGFGSFGTIGIDNIAVNETFDACEFRSYITDYSETTGEGENAVTTYNFPITLSTTTNSDSKLIIKNCRFVNDSTCTVPYFKLDDSAKFDNIVVYNCFFENYEFSEGEGEDKHYPIFGRVVDGAINTDNTDSDNETIHNIFARCNMRSSAPDTMNGTTINETLEYI